MSRHGIDAAEGRAHEMLYYAARTLYHPVLPFRCNGRLLFCLCKTCATEQNTEDPYPHEAVADRVLTATLVIDEIRLAVEKGYRVVEVY